MFCQNGTTRSHPRCEVAFGRLLRLCFFKQLPTFTPSYPKITDLESILGSQRNRATLRSMRGNVKRKYFSLELKWAEDVVSGIQPPCHALCQCVVTKCLGCSDPRADHAHFTPWSSNVVADQREAVGGCWFRLSAFPVNGNVFCRTAWSGQGRTDRCGAANPLPRGPFCDHGERGKAES